MKIVITGSLGHISKPLTEELVRKGHSVTVISSKAERRAEIESLGAKAAIGTMEDADFLTAACKGADAVYCMIPIKFTESDQKAYFKRIADNYATALQNSGVVRVVYLSGWITELIDSYKQIENIFNELPDIYATTIRPGYFYTNFYESMDMIKTKGQITATFGGEDIIVFSSPSDIADAIVDEIENSNGRNNVRYVASDEMSCNEAAKILGTAIGKPELKWLAITDKEMQKGLEMLGLSTEFAMDFIELQSPIHRGLMSHEFSLHKSELTIGKERLMDFAKEFVDVYNHKMKAVRIHEFGGSEVMKIEVIDRPVPAPDEILVKVYASGVNPADWVIREGGNNFVRPLLKLPLTLGWDAAGIIEDVGGNVTGFKKGDEVYGVPNFPGDGSYAEYCAARASGFALKPKSIGFNEAAGVPLAALTAWTGIFENGNLQPGQRILIHGASGGVGSFAVQFAKWQGAYVIGIASGRNYNYLKQLGADEVIDYQNQKFEDLISDIDIVFDASPIRDNEERIKSAGVLKEGGILVSVKVDFPFSDEVREALSKKNAKCEMVVNKRKPEWLQEIARLIDEGRVKVLISKVYPLEQVADAHRESETWHVRGKLVLEVIKEDEKVQ